MYYRLLPQYILRGWQMLPFGLTDTATGTTTFINKNEMEVLTMCNGKIDFDLPVFPEQMQKIAGIFENNGIITSVKKPDPVSDYQEYRFYDNRYIASAHWSITGKCNYHCRHCYMSAFDGKQGEISHEEIMDIINELEKCGIFRVSLTGGEPLLRKDLREIILELNRRHIYIESIYSNGSLINEDLLTFLQSNGNNPEFNISFDGTDGMHDWLRGIDGAFKDVDLAFKLCRKFGFRTAAEMCIHHKNKHTLRDSVNYLACAGCRALKTNPVSNTGAWRKNGYGPSISITELFDLYLDYIPEYYRDGEPLDIMLGGFFRHKKGSDTYSVPAVKTECDIDRDCVCGHARNVMYISPEGRTLPCFSLCAADIQNEYPLIKEKGLKYCLTDSNYMKLIETKVRKVIEHNERCRSCEFLQMCGGGCRASALETTPDDILGIDETICHLFKSGYIMRIRDAVNNHKNGLMNI